MYDSIALLTDSIAYGSVVTISSPTCDFYCLLDVFYKISMVLIAIANIIYVIKLNLGKKKEEQEILEQNRKIDLLKVVVLQTRLDVLYDVFEKINNALLILKSSTANKKQVEKELQIQLKYLQDHFLVYILGVDPKLKEQLSNVSDEFRDGLVETIADQAYNLYVERCYEERVQVPFNKYRQSMISILFNYRG